MSLILFYCQPVVGWKDTFRKVCCQDLVAWELVGQVGDPRMFCSDPLGDFYCFFKGVVGDVLAVSYAVYDEVIQAFELLEFFLGYVIHVSTIGYVPETVAKYRKLVMLSSDVNGDIEYAPGKSTALIASFKSSFSIITAWLSVSL